MGGLDELVSTHLSNFKREFSRRHVTLETAIKTQKLFSTDIFDKTVEYMASARKYEGVKAPSILANIGGADAVLSLYANINQSTRGKPHILFVDRNYSHIDNLVFRLFTAILNSGSRQNYVLDLFGVEKSEVPAGILGNGFNVEDLEKFLLSKKYDSAKHYNMLEEKATKKLSENSFFDNELFEEYIHSLNAITSYLSDNSNYKNFVSGLIKNIKQNPKTHYLTNDSLYRTIGNMIRDGKFYGHIIYGDVTLPDGEASIRKVVEKYNLTGDGTLPFDIAFIPDIKNSMDSLVPFLRKNAGDVIYGKLDPLTNKRYLDTEDAGNLAISASQAPEMEKYKEEKRNRVKLGETVALSPAEKRKGIPPTLLLSNLDIGSKYCDENFLESMAEIAQGIGAERILINGAIYGPFFFWENKRRALLDPEYPSLDAQLRRYAEWRQPLKNVVHVMNDNDDKILDDLNALFVNEYMRRQEGKLNIGTSVGWQREYRNSRWDNAKRVIKEYVYPFLLYLGEDAAGLYSEETFTSPIFELVSGFQRLEEGGILRTEERALLQSNKKRREAFDATMHGGNEKFKVVHEYSELFDGDKTLGIRYTGGFTFSKVTEYSNPIAVPKQMVLRSQNGLLEKALPEQVVADGRAAMFYFGVTGGERVTLLVPGMADDTRYLDPDFASIRQVLSDPTHKRISQQNKGLNLPGGVVISGDIKRNMTVEAFLPFIYERMEQVQKTGQPFKETVIPVIHDIQLGSITERLDMFLKFLDYSIHERGGKGIISVGDLLQGRNYRNMPNENHWLSAVPIGVQQANVHNMIRPFVEYIKFFKMVDGNHEWNSDWAAQAPNYHANINAMFNEFNRRVPEKERVDFRHFEFIQNNKGEIINAPFGFHQEQGANILFSHMYSQQGSGKGSSSIPVTHLSSWLETTGSTAKPYDILLGAHYHQVEMMATNGRLAAILGSNAGESGYEMARGYASVPMNGLLIFKPDGRIIIEIISEQFMAEYKPKNPDIVEAGGVEGYLEKVLVHDAYPIHDGIMKGYEPQKMYKRELKVSK